MSTPIRVLILEDRAADAELMLHELRRAGFDPEWQRVDTGPDFLKALETNPDLILADWSLPQFSGMRALQLMNERGLDIPFFIVSGSIGEEAAVEAMRQGAADYLLKDRLARLGRAVQHALASRQLRQERERAIELLRESEKKFRSFVEQSEDAAILTDEKGAVIEWNQGAERIFGHQRTNMSGRPLWDLQIQIIPSERKITQTYDQLKTNILEALKTGQSSWLNRLVEMAIERSDGICLTIQTMAFPIQTKSGFMLGSISRDITERKRTEAVLYEYSTRLETEVVARIRELRDTQEQLVRQERLAAVGELAGSICHELRNPLGVISNAIYFLKMSQSDASDKVKEYLDILEDETHTSEKIVTDLLDFTRIKSVDRQPVIVSELLVQTLELFPAPPLVVVALEIPSNLPPIFANPHQIVKVLGNLIANAFQAMPEGGKLILAAVAQGDMIEVTVRDSGMGIPPENMKRLFEPLFTTKLKGIGLGLAVSHKLVEANGGRIEVQSEPGKGSTFSVYLPIQNGVNQ